MQSYSFKCISNPFNFSHQCTTKVLTLMKWIRYLIEWVTLHLRLRVTRLMWTFNWPFLSNILPQISYLWRFSWLWPSRCCSRSNSFKNLFPHILHWYLPPPTLWRDIWWFNDSFVLELFSHMLHTKLFSLVSVKNQIRIYSQISTVDYA